MSQDPEVGWSTRPESESSLSTPAKRRCVARFAFEATDDFGDAYGNGRLRTYASPTPAKLFKFKTEARPSETAATGARPHSNTEPIPVNPLHKQLGAQLHVEKTHFGGWWSVWKPRYVEFQPITKCLFYWRKESAKLRGRAKCFDNVVGCQLLFPSGKPYTIMRVSYGGGLAQTKLKFTKREVAEQWANAVAASQVPEPSTKLSYPATPTSGTLQKATPSSSERRESDSHSDDAITPQAQIRSIFRVEFQRQSSKLHVKKKKEPVRKRQPSDISQRAESDSEYSLFSRASYSTREQIPSLTLAL